MPVLTSVAEDEEWSLDWEVPAFTVAIEVVVSWTRDAGTEDWDTAMPKLWGSREGNEEWLWGGDVFKEEGGRENDSIIGKVVKKDAIET